jgi:hypothetical protein
MSIVKYKGFELSPSPYQMKATGEWSVRVTITKHHNSRSETLEKRYTATNTYPERLDAERHSIEFGKRIIDGLQQGLSVDELL